MTPEGKVKKRIRSILDNFPRLHYDMIVPSGYGSWGLDFTCCVRGHYVVIEAKAPGEWLTGRQRLMVLKAYEAGAKVFIVSGDEGLDALESWLRRIYAD